MKFLRRQNFLFLFLSALIFFPAEKIFSQDINSQFSFHHYNEDDGLDNQFVQCLLQDRRGFNWVGTNDGLFRFNGYEFFAFHHSDRDTTSISGNQINSLAEDSKGFIWIGTNSNGVNRFNPRTEKFQHYELKDENPNSHSGRINSIVCSADGKIFLACDVIDGVFQFDEKKNSFSHFLISDFFSEEKNRYSSSSTFSLYMKGNDSLFIGTRSGLFCLDIAKKKINKCLLPNFDIANAGNMLCTVLKENPFSHKLFVGTWGNGVKELNTTSGIANSFWYHPVAPTGMGLFNIIRGLGFLSANEIFVASADETLSLLNTDENTFTFFHHDASNAGSIPDGKCNCVLQDKNGIFWFGFTNGLITYNPKTSRFHNQFFSKETPFINAGSICESVTTDTVFVSTSLGKGIYFYNREGKFLSNINTEPNANGDQFIYESELDDAGNCWFCSGMSWFKFNAHEKKLSEAARSLRLEYLTNSRLVLNGDANQMVLQYGARGIEIVNATDEKIILKKTLHHPTADSSNEHVNEIRRAPDGHYWACYLYSVIEYDKDFNFLKIYPAKYNDTTFLAQGFFYDLVIAPNGNVYAISSDGGMSLIEPEKNFAKNYSPVEYPNAPLRCNGITMDTNGMIWIASEKGITRFNTVTEIFSSFDRQDGLPYNDIDYVCAQPSDRIYYSVPQGWGWFEPKEFLQQKNSSSLVFLSVKVNEKNIGNENADFLKELNLDYTQNSLSFEFALLDFSNAKRNIYAYMLEGADADWLMSGTRRQVTYSQLQPGDYVFKVKAANNEGVWSENIREIKFSIAPPFWQTWWFRILLVLLIALGVYLIFKIRMRIIRREELLKSNYQKKISELETKALRAQMNPHFIFNCLNSINSFILRNDTDVASEYLTKFSRLIRLVLDNSRSTQISLSSELECLKLFIEMEEMRFANKFEYSIHADEKINTETIKVPPLILQPYVENSIWHGLLHKNEKGKLKIEISEQSGYIICAIEDNGIGREAAREAKSKSSGHRKSHGMGITSQRVVEWNHDNESAINISDLFDENKKPAGTRVEIRLRIIEGEK